MKTLFFILVLINIGCSLPGNEKVDYKADTLPTPSLEKNDTGKTTGSIKNDAKDDIDTAKNTPPAPVLYSNKRFKDVTVQNIGNNKFRVKGKGQIFEAAFSWVIEDGHNELKNGFEITDAGAPEWGNFDFVVEAKKQRQNSTLHIILFEISAKDGSRQHELPIKLQ